MIKIGTTVRLSADEIKEANDLGIKRHMNNRKCDVVSDFSGRLGNRGEEAHSFDNKIKVDQRGVRGEFAFAKLFGCGEETWDLIRAIGVQSAASGLDDGDAIMYGSDGTPIKIDVKATEYDSGRLIVTTNKLKGDNLVFVLMTEAEYGVFTYRGCMTAGRVRRLYKNGTCPMRSRSTVWVEQDFLKPVEVAVEYLSTGAVLKH